MIIDKFKYDNHHIVDVLLIPLKSKYDLHYIHNHYSTAILVDISNTSIYLINDIKSLSFNFDNLFVFDKKEVLYSCSTFAKYNKSIYDISLICQLTNHQYKLYSNEFEKYIQFYNQRLDIIPFLKLIELYKIDEYVSYIQQHKYIINSDTGFTFFNNIVLPNMYILETNQIKIDYDILKQYKEHTCKIISSDISYLPTNYTLNTSTYRPTNNIYKLNYMSLNKDNGERAMIQTRYDDGTLLEIDFSSYHISLISFLIDYKLPDEYTNWHNYLGLKYYYTDVDILSDEQYNQSKIKNFKYLYGYDNNLERQSIPFFNQLDIYIDNLYSDFKINGYIESPIHKIKNYLTFDEKNKVFNYLIQLFETEMSFIVINKINQYLINNNLILNFKMVLYVYDSYLFDINTEIITNDQIKDVLNIITNFDLKYKLKMSNTNYNELKQI